MFIIVESGSTKADWMVIEASKSSQHSTKGFNPFFHTQEDILKELNQHEGLLAIKESIDEIFFYGAGCSSNELNKTIEEGLQGFFTHAKIHVDHDLNACAFACYNNTPEIACILGTGSNSCFYDGVSVSEVVPALGYILGDEASGNYFGKRLLADYLYGLLPVEIDTELKQLGLTKASIIESVYQKPDANVFIASFMHIFIKHKALPYAQNLIHKGLQEFIDVHVKCFEQYQQCEVNFVGSLAELLQEELQAVCDKNNIHIGCIIRRPLDRLVNYHLNLKKLESVN